ncbi:hypothetical protein ACI2KR_27130 [Pseudomonas luteola]
MKIVASVIYLFKSYEHSTDAVVDLTSGMIKPIIREFLFEEPTALFIEIGSNRFASTLNADLSMQVKDLKSVVEHVKNTVNEIDI